MNDFRVTGDHRVYLNGIEIEGCHGFDVSVNAENGPEVVLRVAVKSVAIGEDAYQKPVAGPAEENTCPNKGGSVRIDRVKLAAAMARNNLTVKRLAELFGVTRATITSIKNGKSCNRYTAEKLTAVMGNGILDIYP